ncbi:hypothetical protein BN871_AH_00020 [Paenibacillus sp. P22]|nr:hypothetical protein BN871_AH_00020 [Paenibacillus sp. P22]
MNAVVAVLLQQEGIQIRPEGFRQNIGHVIEQAPLGEVRVEIRIQQVRRLVLGQHICVDPVQDVPIDDLELDVDIGMLRFEAADDAVENRLGRRAVFGGDEFDQSPLLFRLLHLGRILLSGAAGSEKQRGGRAGRGCPEAAAAPLGRLHLGSTRFGLFLIDERKQQLLVFRRIHVGSGNRGGRNVDCRASAGRIKRRLHAEKPHVEWILYDQGMHGSLLEQLDLGNGAVEPDKLDAAAETGFLQCLGRAGHADVGKRDNAVHPRIGGRQRLHGPVRLFLGFADIDHAEVVGRAGRKCFQNPVPALHGYRRLLVAGQKGVDRPCFASGSEDARRFPALLDMVAGYIAVRPVMQERRIHDDEPDAQTGDLLQLRRQRILVDRSEHNGPRPLLNRFFQQPRLLVGVDAAQRSGQLQRNLQLLGCGQSSRAHRLPIMGVGVGRLHNDCNPVVLRRRLAPAQPRPDDQDDESEQQKRQPQPFGSHDCLLLSALAES